MTECRDHYVLVNQPKADKPYHYKECGLDNVYLSNGFEIEEVDGDKFVSVHNVDGLWKAIGLSIVTSKKIMSAKEIRFLRGLMDMTQAELASRLRVDDQTYARWEKGRSKQLPGPADVALRACFLATPIAQPEGATILKNWLETLEELLEKDQPICEDVTFTQLNSKWTAKAA